MGRGWGSGMGCGVMGYGMGYVGTHSDVWGRGVGCGLGHVGLWDGTDGDMQRHVMLWGAMRAVPHSAI